MKRKPMKGLLIFCFHAASGNVSLLLLGMLALAVVFSVTGSVFFLNVFLIYAVTIFPMMVITSMASNAGKWEQFQLTMPITRRNLLQMQYLGVLSAIFVSAVFVAGITGLATILHEIVFEEGFVSAMIGLIPTLSIPFLMVGVLFPLAVSKIGKERQGGLSTLCMLGAIGLVMLLPQVESWSGLSSNAIAILFATVSVFIFIVSYPITRALYARIDF